MHDKDAPRETFPSARLLFPSGRNPVPDHSLELLQSDMAGGPLQVGEGLEQPLPAGFASRK